MKLESIEEVLMRRDGLSAEEAAEAVREGMKEVFAALDAGDDPEEVFMQEFGLEPDYLFERLG